MQEDNIIFDFQKIICVDQLYGWRGGDTGYYGSEELEDAPDFLDEVKVLPVQSEIKNGQLGILRKEAEERLKKVVFRIFSFSF